jgi:Ni/Co efflux regulator RcnB
MKRIFTATIIGAMALSLSAFAQDSAKQDIKDAGHDSKEAAKDVGHGTVTATKKTGKAIKHGTKKVVHAAASGTEKGAAKVEDKTGAPPKN